MRGKEQASRERRDTATQKLEELKKEAPIWDSQVRSTEKELRGVEDEYRRCSDNSQGRAHIFGPKIPEILRAIKNFRDIQGFKGEVRGPLGMHVKMKEGFERWGEALEKSLFNRGTLSSFVVTSTDDQRVLMKIFKSLGGQHNVVCQSQGAKYSVPPIEGALTLCDALIVDSDLVFNCIVDQAKIDQTIMVVDEEEVKKHIECHNGLNRFRDSRVKKAITAKGTRIEIRMGNQASQLDMAPFKRLLVADQRELLAGLTERISERKVALREAKGQQTTLYDRLNVLQSVLKKSDEELHAIGSKIRHDSKRKGELRAEIADNQASNIDTTNLEEEKDELQDALNECMVSEVEKKVLYEEVSAKLKELKADVNEAEKKRTMLERDLKREVSKLEKLLEDDDFKNRYPFLVV
jgi:chromosome segregation ATPase